MAFIFEKAVHIEEDMRNNQKQSETIRNNQKQSETIRGCTLKF